MDGRGLEPGFTPVLLECSPKDHGVMVAASRALLSGEDPERILADYARTWSTPDLIIDPSFGATPIGAGGDARELSLRDLWPENSDRFLIRAFVRADSPADVPREIDGELVHSDPMIGASLTRDTSRAVGRISDVKAKLGVATLAHYGLDGDGVALAIVDTGIYLPHLSKQLGAAPALDVANSWTPSNVTTRAGMHRIGHGTMCAYDALVAAPKATLLDVAMLIARPPGEHKVKATISAAMQAYWPLVYNWAIGPLLGQPKPNYKALVVSNSWGIYHPSLDFPPGHPQRFIDNPNHIFRLYIQALALAGVNVVFAGSNCGGECPSAPCLSRKDGMIMGANAYSEVLTLAGCDVYDKRVGYSSKGPSIPSMPQQKPDVTTYTHFLGSKVGRSFLPDTGTSAACAVAAGCVAALRTRMPGKGTQPDAIFQALKDTALKVAGPNWDAGYGHGIIRPVAAARKLGLIP